ncbi:hypothetical protein Tco_0826105 [Tanacetum coccineum]
MSAKGEKIVGKVPVFIGHSGGASTYEQSPKIGVGGFGIGEVALSTLDVLQRFGFFLQMGFTLILATLDGLDVGLLGDVIDEDDCDDDD